ncbi:MAG: hypothetical protein N3D85_06705 [Candidatus Bathyarchaeota archaeon]|nr:hypothetical protein [Candidatus Bathyarchaeota archaeon]
MTLKRFISGLAGTKAPGPNTTFTVFHIYYALELMSERPLGRSKLAEKLNVGEGAVRTIISRLMDAGLIVTSKTGCSLTAKGKRIWRQFEEAFPQRVEVPQTALTSSDFNFGFLVKNCGHKVKSGIDQRDAAIIAGARRCLVVVCQEGHLRIGGVSESIEVQFPEASHVILGLLKPEENDVIVVAGGDSLLKAKRGAFAAGWTLLDG